MTILDPLRRCRNEGGNDVTYCGLEQYGDGYRDVTCGELKPKYRVCHMSAINDQSAEAHFEFTNYSHFTADTARIACENIGGYLPNLEEELDALMLQNALEYITSFVSVGWPFSLRWMTWPVSDRLIMYELFSNQYIFSRLF